MMASSPFFSQNRLVTSGPNCIPTPRLLGPRPGAAWGSVQSISIISPDWPGCLCLCRSNFLMSSRVTLSSEKRPPWSTRYLEPISVARGSAEKLSENNLNTLVPVSGGKSWLGSGHQGGTIPFIILGSAFALKSIHLIHIIRLVVSSVQEHARGPQPLVSV